MSFTALLVLAGLWLMVYAVVHYLQRHGRLRESYRRDVLALGAIALATLGFFWRILFTEGAWMPAGGGDLASFLYPTYRFAAEGLKRGTIPLWNPYLYGGAPFAADIQSGLFYPVNLLFFLLTPQLTYRAMELLAVFHSFLAGAFMYICLRYLEPAARSGKRSPLQADFRSAALEADSNAPDYESSASGTQRLSSLAALAGAVAFMFSDYFVTHFGNLNLIAVGAWLPLIFLFYHRALTEGRWGLAAAAGVCLGMAALAGHIHPFLFIVFLLTLYFAYRVYLVLRRKPRALPSLVGIFALTLGVALGVAALSLIPAYEMMGHTLRAEFGYEQASAYSLPPAKLIGLFIPTFFGRDPAVHWGPWERVEVGYIGVLPLLLALLALLLRRGALIRFWAGLAVLSLLLALGGNTIVHGWLYLLFPGFDRVRAPARFIYLMDFALAALAATGLDALLRPLPIGPRTAFRRLLRLAPWLLMATALLTVPLSYFAILISQDKDPGIFGRITSAANGLLFFLLVLALSLALLYIRRHRWVRSEVLGLLAVGLIAIDLASLGAYLDMGPVEPTQGFRHPEAIDFLKSDGDYYRIDTRTEVWHLWQPNTSLLHDIFDVWGIVNPLTLADYDRYWENMGSRSTPLYDFLNAKYVIARKDVVLDWDKFVPVFEGDPQVNIYLNTKALPRALVVHRALAVEDHERAFAAVQEEGFDPAVTVVVEGGKPLALSPPEPASVDIVSHDLNEIDLAVTTPVEGYLVLSEVYYPGWWAYVDGRSAPVLRANYAFRAVYLEAGSHQVRLVFAPFSWKIGLGFSLITWLGLVVWAALSLRKKGKPAP
ncbi:MAG: YfhO family protein [Anaerolineae bacterium]